MNRSEATVEDLFSLLPDFQELEMLRLRLVGASVPDPGREWDDFSAVTTFDKRLLSAELVEEALRDSEAAIHQYVTNLYATLRPVLQAFWSGQGDEVARLLIRMGEQQEEDGRWTKARKCYRVALSVSLPLIDKLPQILALRRIGRVALTVGELHEALPYYERSVELARDSGELLDEVVGRTGIGNVRVWQGRWADAHACYQEALALSEARVDAPEFLLPRAQLFNNLGTMATRLERLEEADEWLTRALEAWDRISSPYDLAVCYNNLAHLREAQGRRDEARGLYVQAYDLPISSGLRSGLATDLADWYVQEGHLTPADEWSRRAEDHAIAARSPYILGRMYQGRGNVARARGDEDGFIFYEKALEIARDKGYAVLEAETLVDYAQLRLLTGGSEEAQAYLERARDRFRESGSVREQARAEALLAQIAAEAPLAAAGD